jgi:ATP-dependent exoDNAse (exonuclease V) beta subunit
LPADWSHALTVLSLLVDPANDIHAEEVLRRLGSTEEHIGNMRLRAMRDHTQLSTFVFRNVPQPVTFDDAIRALAFLGVGPESLHLIDQRIQVLPNENPTLSDLLADLWRNDKWNVEDPGVGVTVSTIHAAKGREFDVVFVVAMEEGIIPHFNGTECATSEGEIEEERRLAFVAITRARHFLFLSHAAKRTASFGFKELDQRPSRFLEEMTK